MEQPLLTIFCAFTRRWAVEGWLENLANVQHDPARTNLCIIVDCDEQYIANECKKFAEAHGYRSFHVKINSDWHPNEVRLSIRRMRVADVKNQSKDLVAKTDGEIIIGLEDDTVFDRLDSFEQLYKPILDYGDVSVGYVEGVQMGRWGANMVGVWDANDIQNPTHIETLLPRAGMDFSKKEDYQKIIGGGWYGYATRRELYLNHDYYTSSAQPWGPDVNFGFWVRQQGYVCLVDWGIVFGHNDYSKILYPDDPKVKLVRITWDKDKLTGKWERTDHESTRY